MDLAFLVDLRNPPPWERPWADVYGRTLECVEEADRLGGDAVFIGEHHLTADGYIPQPLTFAAAIAARTKRIRIGTSVVVAPFRHPLHIAEEAAVVDVLSGGRLELGLGAGYVPREFEAFGVERTERFRLLDQAIAAVRRLLTDEVTPRPIQERVPIWCGYFGAGARRAGLLGEGLLSMLPWCLEPYTQGLAEGGHDPSRARMAGNLDVVISEDPERTLDRLRPHIDYQASAYATFQDDVARAEGREPVYLGMAHADSYRVLTPDDAVAFFKRAAEGLPGVYVITTLSVGGMPDDIVEEHLRLGCTKVAPALK